MGKPEVAGSSCRSCFALGIVRRIAVAARSLAVVRSLAADHSHIGAALAGVDCSPGSS